MDWFIGIFRKIYYVIKSIDFWPLMEPFSNRRSQFSQTQLATMTMVSRRAGCHLPCGRAASSMNSVDMPRSCSNSRELIRLDS
ncbi:hypothetical protein Poly21_53640 [Allorhodopirellula heiligendammensis]|uniref:Uncharacterized protein n=1 Tax=Allorhodopirellula heiligendammensis TaxID=2714739 RepID=A0A5C6BEW0_9BACT|nr:hypothetical protein Poly21_53640 [Allorhodopirellula heiligendammensis]